MYKTSLEAINKMIEMFYVSNNFQLIDFNAFGLKDNKDKI